MDSVIGRHRDQRGAALVEAALVLPVMITIAIGIIEFGLLFGNYSSANASTRSGARVGAALYSQAAVSGSTETTSQTDALAEIVSSTEADLKAMNNAVPVGMVIYKVDRGATAANGSPIGGFPGPGLVGGCTQSCIKYKWNGSKMVRQNPSSQQWPNPQRCFAGSPASDVVDSIGVFVEIQHSFITGMFGQHKRLTAHTVMRLEPVPSDQC